MKNFTLSFLLIYLTFFILKAQNNNGIIDQIEEIVQKQTIPITMPDGAKLMTDIYLPITGDSLVLPIPVPTLGTINLEIIPKGLQYITYPTKNGQPNPNPFQMPLIFTRTTYDKSGGMEYLGMIGSLMGYAYAIQDNRGVYDSEGAFIPLLSDGWDKSPYSDNQPTIDIFPANTPESSLKHEDGIHMLNYLLDSLKRNFDLNNNGVANVNDFICNGSVGSLGASALAIPAYQMATARKIDPNGPGLKGLLNIIASNEHFGHTLYHNGIYRQGLIKNWVNSQMRRFDDDNLPADNSYFNSIHSAFDYPQDSINDVIEATYDLLTVQQYDGLATYYPNSFLRQAVDASMAPVDANGFGDPNGAYNRYTNYDVPTYHFTGWWDIFTSGQLETWRQIRKHAPSQNSKDFQPLVIGPWAHLTITTQNTGDVVYKPNVGDVLGFTVDLDNIGLNTLTNLNLEDILNIEILSFLRQSLNYNDYANVGEPQIGLPRSRKYQEVLPNTLVQIPGEDYSFTHAELINFLGGYGGLPDVNLKIYNVISFSVFGFTYTDTIQTGSFDVDIPQLPVSIFDAVGGLSQPLSEFPVAKDFLQEHPVRAYIVGPLDDGVAYNDVAGNYWLGTDSFPFFNNITFNKLFLHENDGLNEFAPLTDETPKSYIHDPNDPVVTIGGPNMTIKTPNGDDSQGQMDYARAEHISYTTNHPGIIEFETEALLDTLSVVGYPKMKLYGASMPDGGSPGEPTNTDFVVRVLDIYPDGRELYVFEGAVNARAREYTKSIFHGHEDIDAPFSNIAADRVYEFEFEMLPIGYTFGKDHKIKILVSSSNYPRFQSNPNIPLMPNEFLRWEPGQMANYEFNGQAMQARTAENTIYFQPQFASYIDLPVFGQPLYVCEAPDNLWADSLGNFEVNLNWSQVPGAIEYKIVFSEDGLIWDTTTINGVGFLVEDLEPFTQYYWQVAADCNSNNWSAIDTLKTLEYCDVPQEVWVEAITDSSAIVAWNEVPYAFDYNVHLVLDESLTIFNTLDTFLYLHPLLADTLYEIFIESVCETEDLFSDTLNFSTLVAPIEEDTNETSIFMMSDGGSVQVYPNPFSDKIIIKFNSPSAKNLVLRIYSIEGKMIHQSALNLSGAGQHQVNVANLSTGYYLLEIESETGERFTNKLLKTNR